MQFCSIYVYLHACMYSCEAIYIIMCLYASSFTRSKGVLNVQASVVNACTHIPWHVHMCTHVCFLEIWGPSRYIWVHVYVLGMSRSFRDIDIVNMHQVHVDTSLCVHVETHISVLQGPCLWWQTVPYIRVRVCPCWCSHMVFIEPWWILTISVLMGQVWV